MNRLESKLLFCLILLASLTPLLRFGTEWFDIIVSRIDHHPIPASDFQLHYLPQAEKIWAGQSDIQQGYFYPPLLAILIIPLLWTTNPVFLWTAFLLLSLLLLSWITVKHVQDHLTAIDVGSLFLFSLLCLPVLHCLKWGQISIVICLLSVAALLKGGKWGGLMLGMAAALKGYPILFALSFVIRKDFTACVGSGLSLLLFGFLMPLILLNPADIWIFWLQFVQSGSTIQSVQTLAGGQSLLSSFVRWFDSGRHVNLDFVVIDVHYSQLFSNAPAVPKPHLFFIAEPLFTILSVCSGVLLSLTSLYALLKKSMPHPVHCSLLLCWIALLLPPGWHHYFSFLPFCFFVLYAQPMSLSIRALFWFACAIITLPVLMLNANNNVYVIYSSYGLTTLTTLIFWILLLYKAVRGSAAPQPSLS